MSDHRGRRSHRDDRDYHYGENPSYYDDDDDDYYEPRPHPRPVRKRSLSRKVLDKLGSAMGGLGLNDTTSKSRHHRSRSSSTSPRRSDDDHDSYYYSPSPPRRRHHSPDERGVSDRYYPPSSSRRHHSASPRGQPSRDRDRRHRHSSHPRDYSRGRTSDRTTHPRSAERSRSRLQRGLKAAVEAGAAEAFRLRHEPGPWTGLKASRIATAAISAGVISGAADHRRDEGHHGGGIGPIGSAVGGMIINRLVNGPRKDVRRK